MTRSAPRRFVIGIGSQRAGTTLLHQILDESTSVFMHPLKELHYFDTLYSVREFDLMHGVSLGRHGLRFEGRRAKLEAARRATHRTGMLARGRLTARRSLLMHERTLDHTLRTLAETDSVAALRTVPYASLFEPASGYFSNLGEISPEYMLLPDEGIRYMRDQCGADTSIILLRRDPIARILSSYVLLKAYRSPTPLTPADVNEDEMWQELDRRGLWLHYQYALSDYQSAEQRYSRVFPNVLTIDLESLITGDERVRRDLGDAVGVSIDEDAYRRIIATKSNSFGDFTFSDDLTAALQTGFEAAIAQRRDS